MIKYIIDGLFLTQRMTGTQRYAYEIVRELDKLVKKGEFALVVPRTAKITVEYENIQIIKYGTLNGILWQQISLAKCLIKYNAQGIFLNNVMPIIYSKGVVTIHDVCYKANPNFYLSFRDKMSALWHRFIYWRAVHSKIEIVTVSEFSKSEIIKFYNADANKINIVYGGCQHMNRIEKNKNTFEKYPALIQNKYYFTMSTLAANKNFKWILYAAKNNPDKVFAVAGGGKLKGAAEASGFASLPNIIFLGYISDEDAKTLMENCKAFLFPTFYEGFGLTPLEAVACGTKNIIVSDTPCMREIYGDFAEYVDPYDLKYKMNSVEKSSKNISELLKKYDWKKSAEKLYNVLKECVVR